jgi:hypothetical protein
VTLYALSKLSHLGERKHSMTVGVGGHVIDKVDNAIFQPPGVEAVHHMEHEWARVTFHTQPQ